MKRSMVRMTVFIFILYMLAVPVLAVTELVPVGRVVGLELENGTVTVAGFTDGSPAKAAGLQEGDQIAGVDGMAVESTADVRRALQHSKGSVALTVLRDGRQQLIRLAPTITADGPKLGAYLKEGVTGIGTVTFYDPATGRFGALGHGVNTPDGKLLQLKRGSVYDARVASVRRGEAGKPGQLVGALRSRTPVGSIERNTGCGIFGTMGAETGRALPVCPAEAVQAGSATILSTVDDRVQEYSVEIVKIYSGKRGEGRNMLLRVTDEALLEATGGIVQGMSGSPIVQDGKLVGAITHVCVT